MSFLGFIPERLLVIIFVVVEVRCYLTSGSLLVWPSNKCSTLETFPPLISFNPNLLQEQ